LRVLEGCRPGNHGPGFEPAAAFNNGEDCRDAWAGRVRCRVALQSNATEADLGTVRQHLQDALAIGADCERILKDDLIKNHGANADSPGFRQFEAEYNVQFPAAGLDAARDLLEALQSIDTYLRAPDSRLAVSRRMLLTGTSGIGKTHAIVDYARCGNEFKIIH
jgi:hypothetical protein